MARSNKGKELEAQVMKEVSVALGNECHMKKLYDSSNAAWIGGRVIIPRQEADFIVLKNDPFLEVKTTDNEFTWTMANLEKKQIESILKFGAEDSTIKYFVLLYSGFHKIYYLLPARFLRDRWNKALKKESTYVIGWHEIQEFSIDLNVLKSKLWTSEG